MGKTFESTSVTGYELVPDSVVTLEFIDGRISADAGCNTQNGDADVVDGVLEVGDLASTMMACDEPLMAQEQWLGGFLEDGPEVTLDGTTMTLTSGEVVMELTEPS